MKYNAFVFLFMILIGCNMPEFGKHRSRWVTDASD